MNIIYTMDFIFFSHCHNLLQESLQHFLSQKQIPHDFYQYIFINSVTKIYCFDILSNQIIPFSFHRQDLIKMNLEALIYEKNMFQKTKKNHYTLRSLYENISTIS